MQSKMLFKKTKRLKLQSMRLWKRPNKPQNLYRKRLMKKLKSKSKKIRKLRLYKRP